MARIFAPTNPEVSSRETRNMERVRRIAAEGMVLLENKGVLPLKADGRALAVFGNGVRKMVKGGTGSGDVNSRTVIQIEQGLEEAGFTIATKPWLDRFDQACTDYGAQYMAEFKAILQEKGFAGVNWDTIPLGHPSAPAPSILYPALNLDWRLILYMVLYMFQCHSCFGSHVRHY